MGSSYAMHCTVCLTECSDKKEWTRHLLGWDHQETARREMSQWDDQVRECAVVLYSSFPLVTPAVDEFLEYIYEGVGTSFVVTDFVFSKSSQMTAILQFESREIVQELLLETEGTSSLDLNGQWVQLRKLEEVLELEWRLILESFQGGASFEENLRLVPAEVLQPSSASVLELTSASWPGWVQKDQVCHSDQCGTWTNESLLKCTQEVWSQFLSVLQEVVILDEEFNLVMEAMQIIKALSQEKVPQCQVALYRYNFLQLRNNGDKKSYLLIVHGDQGNDSIVNTARINNMPLDAYFFLTPKSILQSLNSSQKLWKEFGQGRFSHQQLGLEINLLCGLPNSLLEAQLSRLVSYYFHFDERVKVLFALTYYWANANNISFRTRHRPNPATLDWLLLFFLFHKENIVPVPQEILDRPHSPLFLQVDTASFDVGFDFNLDFARVWCAQAQANNCVPDEGTTGFFMSVLELLERFFLFCSQELSELSVLSTRHGELLKPNSNFGGEQNAAIASILKSARSENPPRVLITHPFTTAVLTVVSEEKWSKMICPSINKTAFELSHYINSLKIYMSLFNPWHDSFSGSLKHVLCGGGGGVN